MSQLALLGGKPTKTKPFPKWPIYDEREREALNAVLDSGVWWRTPGTKTLKFEQEFAAYHGAKHGLAITNGTHALEVVLAALNVGPGDEIIVPDTTFVATASAVLFAGAMPVPVDVCPESECINPDLIEAAITPRTKGIIAVHMGGNPADLDRLTEIAKKHNIFLVEDCAHAHGSEWNGTKVGNFGIAGTFSFQSSKLMTAGEGGLIIINDDEMELKSRSASDCGRLPGKWFYDHFNYGSNYRLSEWQGAVLSVQLSRLDEQTARRDANSRLLDKLLADVEGITPQKVDARCTRNGHYAYIFRIDPAAFGGMTTDKFIKAMNAEGIPNQAAYPPIHSLDLFKNNSYRQRLCGDQAKAEHAFLQAEYPGSASAAKSYWVTQYALLGDDEDMHEIVAAIKKIQQNASELASA